MVGPAAMNIAIVLLVVLGAWLLLVAAFARRLAADWREPVLTTPVLIIESDDWGPGPVGDGARLRSLCAALQEFRDRAGHAPVLTLGVVLAAPGGELRYVRDGLDSPGFTPIRDAMIAGRDAGVFALQLHSMEHFWPPTLEAAASTNGAARDFLQGTGGVPRHESLPSHLQARWVDVSRLPSAALKRGDVERAAAEETAYFARVFGEPARVAVPVTFTWTMDVEAAWAAHGVGVVVTPGTRNTGRDAAGRLTNDGSLLRNGDRGPGGIVYVVRDVYFEPALGHEAAAVLRAVRERHRLGRPALLEMHRFNFTGDETLTEHALAELRRLLHGALLAAPSLRFMSTEALAEALRRRDPALVDARLPARVRAFILRAATHRRLRVLAWVSGLALAAAALLAIASGSLQGRAHSGAWH